MSTIKKSKKFDVKDFGYTNEVYRIEKQGSRFLLINTDGEVATAPVGSVMRRTAGTAGKAVRGFKNRKGKNTYRIVDIAEYNMLVAPLREEGVVTVEEPKTHDEIKRIIHTDSIKLKPRELVIKDLKWKYLVRSAVRGKNIMMKIGRAHV